MADFTVLGVIFSDVKGFPFGKYNRKGRNLGDIKIVHGGVSRNVAENIACMGRPVRFVSLTDHSAIGRDAILRLKRSNVDVSHVLTVDGGLGMWLVVLDDKGDAAGEISKMPDTTLLEAHIDNHGDEIIKEAGCVLVGVDTGETFTEKVLDLCERYGKNAYATVGNMSIILKRQDFIKRTRCFICNEGEMAQVLEADIAGLEPEHLLEKAVPLLNEKGFPTVIITMGEKGAVYYDPKTGDSGFVPAEKVTVKDTSGAGDAFLTGAIVSLEEGKSLGEAAKIGTYLAARVLERDESSFLDMKIDIL